MRITKVKNLLKDRTFKTLVLSVVLIILMGSVRPNKTIRMDSLRYAYNRRQWQNCADIVLGGDSRVLMALSPDEMKKILKGQRILNFSQAGVWYSKKYLEALENILDPVSSSKTIILGISPRSLTEGVRDNPGAFAADDKEFDKDAYIEYIFSSLLEFCQPMSFDQILPGIFPSLASSIVIKGYHSDGWMSADCTVNNRGKWAVNRYRRVYDKYPVLESTIKNIMEYTKNWSDAGIKVYGFFPPSCKEIVKIEGRLEAFDQGDFIKRFRQNNGIWLDIDQTAYESYDGCHLQKNSALKFSNDLAKMIY